MAMIEDGALRIDCEVVGAGGPPVVLVHSSASGNRQWRKLAARLADRARVVAPNLHGYGATTPWPAGRRQTLADAARVVTAVCATLPGPLRLVGHSWGGAIALWVARTLGERVSHLALYEPMLAGLLHAHAHPAAAEVGALHADVRRHGARGDWTALGRRFTDYFNGEGSWAASTPERQAAIAAALPPNVDEWEACAAPIRAEAFDGIAARCLLMRGERTRPALRAMGDVLAAHHRHWQVEDLADGSHMAPLAQAEAFNRRVDDFLECAAA